MALFMEVASAVRLHERRVERDAAGDALQLRDGHAHHEGDRARAVDGDDRLGDKRCRDCSTNEPLCVRVMGATSLRYQKGLQRKLTAKARCGLPRRIFSKGIWLITRASIKSRPVGWQR